jgi:hypothetical protein
VIEELLKIYEEGRVNPGTPECMFAETLIFSEGWMLRAATKSWLDGRGEAAFAFLPFPPGVVAYSEGQLYTPFRKRARADALGEAHTHVDGIVGQFSIDGSKSGVTIDPDCRYLAVFEAKMYGGLSRGVTNAPGYDQVARTAACMIHGMLEAVMEPGCPLAGICESLAVPGESKQGQAPAAYLVVLYPEDNERIVPGQYTQDDLHARIAARVERYVAAREYGTPQARFFSEWEAVLPRIEVAFVTWEQVVAGIDDPDLRAFYELCRRFNGG